MVDVNSVGMVCLFGDGVCFYLVVMIVFFGWLYLVFIVFLWYGFALLVCFA